MRGIRTRIAMAMAMLAMRQPAHQRDECDADHQPDDLRAVWREARRFCNCGIRSASATT